MSTETFHTPFPFYLSQGSLSCIIWARSVIIHKIFTNLFEFHNFLLLPPLLSPHSTAWSFLKQLQAILLFCLWGKITQTLSSVISVQKYTEKRNLKYSIAYYQEWSSTDNSPFKEESGKRKHFLQSETLQCHWSSCTGLNCCSFELILFKNMQFLQACLLLLYIQ